jgi:lipopolysaccharide export system protein LptA
MTKSGLSIVRVKSFALVLLIGLLAFSGVTQAQNRKRVEILRCDLLDVNERIVANAKRLLGNVNITVDGALMWCDSMYSYTNNSVDAFGNVHIVRGDTLNMYADFIHYDPATKLAKARRNVKLIDKQMTLTTDSLDYSMINDLASYNYSGTVKDSTNVLTSTVGQYYVNEKKAYFKTKVDGVTKDYKIKSDTLIYFTNTKKVFIEGPTHIFNEKDTLYAEYGWYDSMKSYARLTKKPIIWNEKQKVKADSIYYDKENGEGLAMGNARIQDIENSIIVVGNRVKYNDLTKIASATDSAVLIQYSKTDSLFLHADYLKTMPDTTTAKKPLPDKKLLKKPIVKKAVPDSLSLASQNPELLAIQKLRKDSLISGELVADTLRTDTLATKPPKDARLVLAYHRVRFFRDDIQGKCDSLAYWSKDSTIQMFTQPIIWSDKNQISASYIEMINRSKDPDEVRMKDDAFIIAMEDDSLRFNQIKGKNMTGYVRNNELYKIDVSGNGQSNYYARDKNGVIGLNKAESSNITIYMNKGKVKKIAFIKSPDGELKPLAELESGDKLLPGFNWQAEIRPKNKEDIFLHPAPEATAAPETKTKTPPVPDQKLKPAKPGNALAE